MIKHFAVFLSIMVICFFQSIVCSADENNLVILVKGKDGKPVGGAYVYLSSSMRADSGFSDVNGIYQTNFTDGPYSVTVSAEGYQDTVHSGVLERDSNIILQMEEPLPFQIFILLFAIMSAASILICKKKSG